MKVLFVINPKAGSNNKEVLRDLIKEKAGEHLFNYDIIETKGSDDKTTILNKLNSYNPEIVASVGGDGTCNLIANILADRNEKLAIIPYGSSNGMATELNIPQDVSEAIDVLAKGVSKKIDMITINGTFCIHLADVGLNAKLIRRFERHSNGSGWWGYTRHLLKELLSIRRYSFEIQADDLFLKRKAIMITFANASKYGTGAIINPTGKLDDGLFELCIIKPFPWYYLLIMVYKFFNGKIHFSKYVEVISCKEAKIKCNKKLRLQFDGEMVSKTREINARIKASVLNIIVNDQD